MDRVQRNLVVSSIYKKCSVSNEEEREALVDFNRELSALISLIERGEVERCDQLRDLLDVLPGLYP